MATAAASMDVEAAGKGGNDVSANHSEFSDAGQGNFHVTRTV